MSDNDFAGHIRRDCGEHRTTGERAWCYDCQEWCYPHALCVGCALPRLEIRLNRIAEAHTMRGDDHGGVSGYCPECDLRHPCPTYVWATTDRDPLSTWDPDYDETPERQVYQAVVTRDGDWWMVHIPALDQVTQARSHGEVEVMARDLIAITTDLPDDAFDMQIRHHQNQQQHDNEENSVVQNDNPVQAQWYALDRDEDVSGISGTGRVAYLLHMHDEGVMMLWDSVVAGRPSCGIEWLPDLDMVRSIHCHEGKTRLTSLLDDEIARLTARYMLIAAMQNLSGAMVKTTAHLAATS